MALSVALYGSLSDSLWHSLSQRQPERIYVAISGSLSLWHFLSQREPERISVALSGSLWFSLSGSLWRSLWLSGWFSLSPTLSLCGSLPLCLLSGSL